MAILWVVNGLLHVAWISLAIYIWNQGGASNVDLDTLSMSMTAVEVTLVVLGVVGFGVATIVADRVARRAAPEAAKDEARELAKKIARETAENLVRSELPALVRRELADQHRTDSVLGDPDDLTERVPASTLDREPT